MKYPETMPISVNNSNNVHLGFGRGIEPIMEKSNADYATNFKAEAMEQIMPSQAFIGGRSEENTYRPLTKVTEVNERSRNPEMTPRKMEPPNISQVILHDGPNKTIDHFKDGETALDNISNSMTPGHPNKKLKSNAYPGSVKLKGSK